ncbi:unnamed protein product [Cuscuta europaea]|uniref:Uncharacterized protein n=1 Tax=Cuscuta europaea TaxID=41803 RepID=A0A9P1EDS7_CUSEU|nr:unnamed protein product [Cuscuta europaea]
MAGSLESRVSTPVDPPPQKKPKTATDGGSDCVSNKESDVLCVAGKIYRKTCFKDKEYQRQYLLFEDQFVRSEGANVEFVEPVKANFWCCAGHCFWITFRARDLSSNTDTKLYQTKVWRFMDKIEVCIFRERPTDEEIASVHVEIPEYACFK